MAQTTRFSTVTDAAHFYGNTTPADLVGEFGSPLYVYNEQILRARCKEMRGLSTHPGFCVNYSAKANTNPALLRIAREEGCLVDAMSPGELRMNQRAGFGSDEMLYVCNNVSAQEMRLAVDAGVLVSVDSLSQLDRLGSVNPGGKVMVRFNPGIGAGHHEKVITGGKNTKFGINPEDMNQVRDILAAHNLTLAGINQHIGSLFMEPGDYLDAVETLLHLAARVSAFAPALEIIDFGGGFGIPYHKQEGEKPLDMQTLSNGLHSQLCAFSDFTGYKGRYYIEPGRYLVAESGVLLGTVQAVKHNGERCYVGTDMGFNQLMRPALYDAHHEVEIYRNGAMLDLATTEQTVVGNICESGDVLARSRELPVMREGDILGILDAGAYGFVMASSYNLRMRPAEVLITADGNPKLIRRRETLEDVEALLID